MKMYFIGNYMISLLYTAFCFAISEYNHTIYCWHVFRYKICKIFQSINFAKQPVNLNEIRWDLIWILFKIKKKQQNFSQNVSLNFFIRTRTKMMTNSFGWLIFTPKNQIRINNQRCELDCSRAICRITKQPFQFFSCACPFI